MQLDRCSENHAESHDCDASKYLTYARIIAVAYGVTIAPQQSAATLRHIYTNGWAVEARKKYPSSFDSEHVSSCPYVKSAVDCSAIERNHDQRFFWVSSDFQVVRNKVVCYIGRAAQ
jgi:hypothetical protein